NTSGQICTFSRRIPETLMRRQVFQGEECRAADGREAHDKSHWWSPMKCEPMHEHVAQTRQRAASTASNQSMPPLRTGADYQDDDDVESGDGELQRADRVDDEDCDCDHDGNEQWRGRSSPRRNGDGSPSGSSAPLSVQELVAPVS